MSLTGADILLRCLRAQGVRAVFGMPGTQNVALYDAFHRSGEGISHYLVRHEQGATMLANGFSRASGEVGVAFTVPGPGATNAATGVLDALTDCVPLLLVVGGYDRPFAKRDRTKRVADQGTYSGTPLVAAAAIAQLEVLKTGEVQRELNRLGDRLRAGMNQALKTRGVRGCVYGASSMFRVFLGADAAELGLDDWTMDAARLDRGMGAALSGPLHLAMLVNGVDTSRGNSNGWMNGAMTDKDIDQIVDAFDRSLARLQEERRLA